MRITQATKLSSVLRFGFLSTLTKKECNKKGHYLGVDFTGKQVFEFTPYDDNSDLEITIQLSDNPFTLIDSIFKLL